MYVHETNQSAARIYVSLFYQRNLHIISVTNLESLHIKCIYVNTSVGILICPEIFLFYRTYIDYFLMLLTFYYKLIYDNIILSFL